MATQATVQLPELPYSYSALEPIISGEIMELHHSKHHQAYVNGYNTAYKQFKEAEEKKDVEKIVQLQSAIKFNGGGHVNHTIFWKNLTPPEDFEPPSGEIAKQIEADFGSLDKLIPMFNAKTAAIQGSGWGWLGYSKEHDKLVYASTPNQDPLVTQGLVPVLGVDVWEHAYYKQYNNLRPEYLKNIWKIINWKDVDERLRAAKA
ncbi:superoxide dismutase [Mn] [Coccomyxa subellipsoidea C-169]|uniref:Superoxide dismutase n=1 Tax=Coccomyxa subellipsoidea (strain C-169) TaxID=574566 RepID=I0YS50_COCSC|nr:superoxide dismutase [Mn] [Coccomyxa subellipsoidea C-169]EIE21219.1 superoxide dismutase [Mn] [Coccomyxa subellipsoidea C-169]|eukprot:XP_005645763.1 superoxide dismutase [Mn] [Coccomyxa subellipsoidea C-169]